MKTIDQLQYLELNLAKLIIDKPDNLWHILLNFKKVVQTIALLDADADCLYPSEDFNRIFIEMLEAWPPNEIAPDGELFGL